MAGAATVLEGFNRDEFALFTYHLAFRKRKGKWIEEFELDGYKDHHERPFSIDQGYFDFEYFEKEEIAFKYGRGKSLISLGRLTLTLIGYVQIKRKNEEKRPTLRTGARVNHLSHLLGLGMSPELEFKITKFLSIIPNVDFRLIEIGHDHESIANFALTSEQRHNKGIIIDWFGQEAFLRLSLAIKL